jgi:hypothetical protein
MIGYDSSPLTEIQVFGNTIKPLAELSPGVGSLAPPAPHEPPSNPKATELPSVG